MRNPYTTIYFDFFRLGCESSFVIGLRMMTLAGGGTRAMSEARLMTAEKVQSAMVVTLESMFGMARGRSTEALGRSAISHYRRKVKANHRRLLRRT